MWADLRDLRKQLSSQRRSAAGSSRCGTCRRSSEHADRLLHPRRLRRVVGSQGERLHALLGRPRRHPGDVLDRLVRSVSEGDGRVLRRDGGSEPSAAAARDRPVEPRRDARRRDLDARRRLRRAVALGRARGTSRSSWRSSTAGSARTATAPSGWAPAGKPVRIFVMGGGSGRKTAAGKLDHGGHWRDEDEWPLARARPTTYYLHGDGSLTPDAACGRRRAAALHVRPGAPGADDRRALLLGRRAAGRAR